MIKRIYEIRKLLFLAIPIGVVAGLLAVAFLYALDFSTSLFLGKLAGYYPPKPCGEGEKFPV
jgi:CIC family chloride channel protein